MYYTLLYIALFIGIIPLLILFFKKRAFSFKEPVIPFIWLTFLATLYEGIGVVLLKLNLDYWSQIYSLLEFVTIFYFYYKLYNFRYKTSLILLFVIYGISFYLGEEYSVFVAKAVNKIPLTFLVLFGSYWWVRDLFRNEEAQNIWQNPTFYFMSAFYIYYLVTMPLFLMGDFIFNSNLYFYDFAMVNIMATFILRTILTIGAWKMN